MEIEEVQDTPKLCTRMVLWELPDQYILQPIDSPSTEFLSIDRTTGDLSSISELPDLTGAYGHIVFGLVGLLRLLVGTYALVITGRKHLGLYKGHPIYKVTSMKVLSCNKNLPAATIEERYEEAEFVSLLKSLESTPGLYFSYNSDLTLNAGRSKDVGGSIPLWKQAEEKYLWNKTLLEDLIQNELEPFILPLIQGSFQTIESKVNGEAVKVSLIARRCNRRTGTRMWRRGADMDSNVANFVESEQILETKGYLASYTQVRGSIPLLWEQIVDLFVKPKIRVNNNEITPVVIERHFRDLRHQYGDVLAIDLIKQQGSERVLSVAYGENMQRITNESIRYLPFDFHHICGRIHFERLSYLYDGIREDLSKQGYFLKGPNEWIQEEQKGVVRTNCVDCLDRTNVTQSLLGRKALEVQLKRIGTLEENDTIQHFEDFAQKFKFLWADHGDDISIQYTGTGALKGDFVRYGKMGIQGLIQDWFKSAARYYYNNFRDGFRQDSMDLVAGHYTVDRGTPSPLRRDYTSALSLGLEVMVFLILGMIAILDYFAMKRGLDGNQYVWTLVLCLGGLGASFVHLYVTGPISLGIKDMHLLMIFATVEILANKRGLDGKQFVRIMVLYICLSVFLDMDSVILIAAQREDVGAVLFPMLVCFFTMLVGFSVVFGLQDMIPWLFHRLWGLDVDKFFYDVYMAVLIGLWIVIPRARVFISRPKLCPLA